MKGDCRSVSGSISNPNIDFEKYERPNAKQVASLNITDLLDCALA
jgi:hypothetical protein